MIQNYFDFTTELLHAGFSMGGGNSEGIYAVVPFSWEGSPAEPTPVRWHTGDPETDPWEWRMRVLDERNDIAYAKVFFRKSGYITKEWYPCFLAVRRGDRTVEKEYADGVLSSYAKRVYDVLQDNGSLPVHLLKPMSGFGREDQTKFEKALVDLQMKLYITLCGRQQKVSQAGEGYGWSSTVFCTTERFWGNEVFAAAAQLSTQEAETIITEQIYRLNPAADPKKIVKFIR